MVHEIPSILANLQPRFLLYVYTTSNVMDLSWEYRFFIAFSKDQEALR